MTIRLQVALDTISINDAVKLIGKIQNDIDIVEVGTPMMLHYGIKAIETIGHNFPQLGILCDAKIMDAGNYEAKLALDAGANYITVLGLADDLTIEGVIKAAHEQNKKAVADLINVNDFSRIKTLESMGIDVIAIHTGADAQAVGRTPLDDLKEIRPLVKKAKLAVAGGIKKNTVDEYLKESPDIVIVGGGILNSSDPIKATKEISEQVRRD